MPELGFTVPLAPLAPGDQLEYAVVAERLGYASCWLAEAVNADSFSLGGAIAARTSLEIGTGIVPVYNRTPMILAMSAATMAHLTDDRFVLGLGVSTTTIMSEWNGVALERPVRRMRETVHVVRGLLAGEKVSFTGETLHVAGARLEAPPGRPPPIYLAALNPGMLRLAGEVADGVIVNLLAPEHLPRLLSEVAIGARSVGRDPAHVKTVVRLQVAVTPNPADARDRAREMLWPYLAASGYEGFFRSIGFGDEVSAVAHAARAGDRAAAKSAMTDRVVDALLVYGSPEQCRNRLSEYRDAGADSLVIMPLAASASECWQALQALAPASLSTA